MKNSNKLLLRRLCAIALAGSMAFGVTGVIPAGVVENSITVNAVSTYGDFQYSVSGDNATITKYTSTGGTVTIPATIDGKTVTAIGSSAFSGCTGLTKISLPDSLKSIGESAFSGCTGIREIKVSAGTASIGKNAFLNCTSLEKVSLPDDASVGHFAFSGDNIKLVITKSTGIVKNQYLYSSSYYGYSRLDGVREIEIGEGITEIGNEAFYYSSSEAKQLVSCKLPSTLKAIGARAFANCTALTGITLPTGIETIGNSAFSGCSSMTKANFPTTITSIGESAFSGCALMNVTLINLPNAATIGNSAFLGCAGIREVKLPVSAVSIGNNAFQNCTSLQKVSIPDDASVGHFAFSGDDIKLVITKSTGIVKKQYLYSSNYYGYSRIDGIREIEISEGITDIEKEAFYYSGNEAKQLVSVSLPSTLKAIGDTAFSNCTSMAEMNFPKALEKIGTNAFSGCAALETALINLPNLTSIGESAFSGCSSINEVRLTKSGVSVAKNAFKDCTALKTVYLPDDASLEYYIFTGDSIKLVITKSTGKIPKQYLYSNGYYGNSRHDGIKDIVVSEGITEIGDDAFYYYYSKAEQLTSVTLPSTLTAIGNNAFANCSALTQVTLPKKLVTIGNSAFSNCSSLKQINFPTTLTSIGDSAFLGCGALEANLIELTKVTSVGASAFSGCANIKEVKLPVSGVSIGDKAFENCTSLAKISMPDSASIGFSVFTGDAVKLVITKDSSKVKDEYLYANGYYGKMKMDGIKQIEVSEGITEIGNEAFYFYYSEAKDLTDISLPSTLKTIGSSAFKNCTSLTDVTMPDGLETIGSEAFSSCTGLKNVDFPETLKTIGNSAFLGCSAMESKLIDLPNVTSVGTNAFSGCTSIRGVNLRSSKVSLGDKAFENCTSLETVTLPDNASIGLHVFNGDSIKLVIAKSTGKVQNQYLYSNGYYGSTKHDGIREIKVSEGITEIGNEAFYYYNSTAKELTNVELPKTLKTIGDTAFKNCSALTEITIPQKIETVGKDAFVGCTDLTINGYKDTDAERYAKDNGINFVELPPYTVGDVNNNESIDIADALMVARYDSGLVDLNDTQKLAGDVNDDEEVNVADALMIARYDAGLITEFPL